MARPPSDTELLKAIYADSHQAADCVSKAWRYGGFMPEQADAMLGYLRRATTAMESLHGRIRGSKTPAYGPRE